MNRMDELIRQQAGRGAPPAAGGEELPHTSFDGGARDMIQRAPSVDDQFRDAFASVRAQRGQLEASDVLLTSLGGGS